MRYETIYFEYRKENACLFNNVRLWQGIRTSLECKPVQQWFCWRYESTRANRRNHEWARELHWKLWDFGSDLLCHDLRSHDHWPDFGHTLVSITKTLFPTPNLSEAHYWHRVRETQACHLVQRTVIKEVPKGKSSDDRYRNIASTKTQDPRTFVLDWKGERARISRNPALTWTRGAILCISTKKSNEKS